MSRTIRVRETSEFGQEWIGKKLSAIIKRIGGSTAFFFQDYDLPKGYGQIFKPIKSNPNCNTSVTGRVSITELGSDGYWHAPSESVFEE